MPFDLYFLAGIFWQQGPPLVVVSSSSICTVQGRWNQGGGRGDDLCQLYLKQGLDYYLPPTAMPSTDQWTFHAKLNNWMEE